MVTYLEHGFQRYKVKSIENSSQYKSVFERDYHLGDKKLERVTVEQDLGIWITQDLSWNTHVEYVTAKAKKMLNVLHHSCKDISDLSINNYFTSLGRDPALNKLVWCGHLTLRRTT